MAEEKGTFGLLGQLVAQPGKRDELIACLRESSRDVPGKLVYMIALDRNDPDSIWMTEVWRDEAAYDACLTLPAVKAGAARMGELIARAGPRIETVPLD
jgi:quinol monooxygenase YgiN